MHRRPRLPAARVLLLAALLLSVSLAAACGNDQPPEAIDIVPDLEDQGFVVADEGRDPFAPPGQDMYRKLYVDPDDESRAVAVIVYVQDDEDAARQEYAVLAEALANPPPEFFGAEADQAPGEPLDLGDERTAYVTAQPDARGQLIWTDIVRSGQVVFITQVLGTADVDQVPARGLVAERIIDATD